MYLDHRICAKIARILEMADSSALLLDPDGNVLVPEGDGRLFNLPEQVRNDPQTPMVYGGVTLIGTATNPPAFICLHGDNADVRKCARLCGELVGRIMREDVHRSDAGKLLHRMLGGEIDADEIEALAAEQGMTPTLRRCVLTFRFRDMDAEEAIELLGAVRDSEEDLMTVMSRNTVAVVKNLPDEEAFEEVGQYADAVVESFLTESGRAVVAGISDPIEHVSGIAEAYRQSREAIGIGSAYHGGSSVFFYRNLLLERFLSEVPAALCERYNGCIFNRENARLFNEEMLRTIEAFFENSLNLSETARRLCIHRNTLVYRIEKLYGMTGLDLRNFDDAVTFKMMMMLGKRDGAKRNNP